MFAVCNQCRCWEQTLNSVNWNAGHKTGMLFVTRRLELGSINCFRAVKLTATIRLIYADIWINTQKSNLLTNDVFICVCAENTLKKYSAGWQFYGFGWNSASRNKNSAAARRMLKIFGALRRRSRLIRDDITVPECSVCDDADMELSLFSYTVPSAITALSRTYWFFCSRLEIICVTPCYVTRVLRCFYTDASYSV